MPLVFPVTKSDIEGSFAEQDTFDEICTAVMSILEEGRPEINKVLKSFGLTEMTVSKLRYNPNELGEIVRGHRKQIARFTAISVDEDSCPPTWFATGVRREDHQLSIQCYVRIVKKDIVERYINVFARCVQNWLNYLDNLQYTINETTGASVFDSWASDYTKGYSSDGALRIARIPYRATTTVPQVKGCI